MAGSGRSWANHSNSVKLPGVHERGTRPRRQRCRGRALGMAVDFGRKVACAGEGRRIYSPFFGVSLCCLLSQRWRLTWGDDPQESQCVLGCLTCRVTTPWLLSAVRAVRGLATKPFAGLVRRTVDHYAAFAGTTANQSGQTVTIRVKRRDPVLNW